MTQSPVIEWLPNVKLTQDPKARERLQRCYEVAKANSQDPHTQNGALLVCNDSIYISDIRTWEGTNRLPEGVTNLPERWDRAVKLFYVEHAERNALFDYWQDKPVDYVPQVLYCPWYACADCARAIIAAKVPKIVGHKQMFDKTTDRWKDSIKRAFDMFDESGIICEVYDGKIDETNKLTNLFSGEVWNP